MRMALIRAKRHWRRPGPSKNSTSLGLKNRFHQITSKDCGLSEIAHLLEWISQLANTVTTSIIFGGCSKPARSMFYKPTLRVAADSLDFCKQQCSVTRITFLSRRTARLRCTFTLAALRRQCATPNIFMITSAWSECFLTGLQSLSPGHCVRHAISLVSVTL